MREESDPNVKDDAESIPGTSKENNVEENGK
jgi:hypothetical protein